MSSSRPNPSLSARATKNLATAAAFTVLAGGCLGAGPTADRDPSGRAEDTPKASVAPRIVGGQNAEEAYPFMVSLRHSSGKAFCGGTVVSRRTILTAAHCVVGGSPLGSVLVGSRDVDGADGLGLEIGAEGIREVIAHEGYSGATSTNDLALIVLKELLPSRYTPLEVSSTPTENLVGEEVTAIGWGYTEDFYNRFPEVLQEVSLPIIDRDRCAAFPDYNEVDETMVCTYRPGQDGCQGDIGGPLFFERNGERTLVGVTSWGWGCADENAPGVWADVEHNEAWIKHKIEAVDPLLWREANFTRAEGDENGPGHSADKALDGDADTIFWSRAIKNPRLRLSFDGNRQLEAIDLKKVSSLAADNSGEALRLDIHLYHRDGDGKDRLVYTRSFPAERVKWEQNLHWTTFTGDRGFRDVSLVEIEQRGGSQKGHLSVAEVRAFEAKGCTGTVVPCSEFSREECYSLKDAGAGCYWKRSARGSYYCGRNTRISSCRDLDGEANCTARGCEWIAPPPLSTL